MSFDDRTADRQPHPQPARLGRVEGQELLALVELEAHRHAILLWTDLAASLPPVHGDRVQLQQVILNLVVNAIQALGAVEEARGVVAWRRTVQSQATVG